MAGEVKVNILTGFNDKGVKEAVDKLKGLSNGFKNVTKQLVGGYIGWNAFNKGVGFIRESIDASRDLQRNMAGLKTIFGEATAEMTKFAEGGVAMGMSTAEAAKATTFIGSVMKQSGFAMKDNIYYTKQLVSLGSDLAATYGYDVQEALTGMTALFRGEYDPIEKFGVAIKQQQVNTMLAEQGLSKLTGTQKLHAQQLARMILLFKATNDVQGAFSRQTRTLAVAQQQLSATFTNLQSALGNTLITPVTNLVVLMRELTVVIGPSLQDLFMSIGSLIGIAGTNASNTAIQISSLIDELNVLVKIATPFIQGLAGIMASFGATIISTIVAFKALRAIVKGVGASFEAFGAITSYLASRQAALKLTADGLAAAETAVGVAATESSMAMAATPWGAIGLAVATLGAALVLLGGAFVESMAKAAPASESLSDFQARVDETGNVSAYGTAVFSLSNNFDSLTDSALKAIAATTVWKNLNKQDNSDIFTRSASNKRKPSTTPKMSKPLTEAEKALADYKKLMKDMGLLGGSLDPQAKKLTKSIADPFKTMVKEIQSSLAQVHDSIMSTFDITNMGTNGGSISRNIDRFMVKLREFAGYIQTLRGMNLNGALLQQLAMAGPENGLAAAKAFANDASLVGQANAAYGELGMTASAISGNVVQAKAAPIYNISVNAGVGDKKTIGLAVVEAIKSYERTNGTGWRR